MLTFLLIALGVALMGVAFRFPGAGVAFSLHVYVLRTSWSTEVIPFGAEIGAILTLLLVGIVAVRFRSGWKELRLKIEDVVLGVFMFFALLSCLWTSDVASGLEKGIRLCITVVTCYGMGRIWPLVSQELQLRWAREFVFTTVIIAAVLLLLGLIPPVFFWGRLSIGTTNVIPVGMVVAWSLVFLLQQSSQIRGWNRFAMLGLAAVFFFGLVSLNTKGPILGFLGMLPALLLLSDLRFSALLSPKKKIIVAFLGFGLFAGIGLSGPGRAIVNRVVNVASERSTGQRLELFGEALRMWENHLIAGEGLGSFSLILEQVPDPFKEFDYPHNLFLEIACELGSIGLFLIVSFLLCIFVRSCPLILIGKSVRLSILSFLALTGFLLAFTLGMVSFSLPMQKVLFLCSGLLVSFSASSGFLPFLLPQKLVPIQNRETL